jgi:hypothetical protein
VSSPAGSATLRDARRTNALFPEAPALPKACSSRRLFVSDPNTQDALSGHTLQIGRAAPLWTSACAREKSNTGDVQACGKYHTTAAPARATRTRPLTVSSVTYPPTGPRACLSFGESRIWQLLDVMRGARLTVEIVAYYPAPCALVFPPKLRDAARVGEHAADLSLQAQTGLLLLQTGGLRGALSRGVQQQP